MKTNEQKKNSKQGPLKSKTKPPAPFYNHWDPASTFNTTRKSVGNVPVETSVKHQEKRLVYDKQDFGKKEEKDTKVEKEETHETQMSFINH